jgi:ribose-phosphate pyrophosphokinase
VAVDKGAITRAGLAAEAFNCDIIYADKNRVDGTIIGHKIKSTSKTPEPSDNIWVIDDLCDGGATFISIAKLLRENYEFNQLNLYVTHGLFSKGKEELFKYYDNILSRFDYSETK